MGTPRTDPDFCRSPYSRQCVSQSCRFGTPRVLPFTGESASLPEGADRIPRDFATSLCAGFHSAKRSDGLCLTFRLADVPRLPVIILSPAVEGRPYEAGHMGRRPDAFPTRAPQRAQVTASLSGEGCLSGQGRLSKTGASCYEWTGMSLPRGKEQGVRDCNP
jgi:hypothetical protein